MAKQNKKQSTPVAQEVAQEAPVQEVAQVAQVVEPVAQEAPVAVQQGGKKKRAQPVQQVAEQVQPVQQVAEPVQQVAEVAVQEGAKRKRQAKQQDTTTSTTTAVTQDSGAESSAEQQGGKRKRTTRTKAPVDETATTTQVQTQDEPVVDSKGRHLRSFKVRLPGNEGYEGRFTGLTPYQAANKALSKYFRLAPADSSSSEVTFSICESTRNSRKAVYTYVGARVRLEKPVEYSIDGGRVIVKNFKNSLRKVKKVQQQAELAQEA